jgi:hypothetical protein
MFTNARFQKVKCCKHIRKEFYRSEGVLVFDYIRHLFVYLIGSFLTLSNINKDNNV